MNRTTDWRKQLHRNAVALISLAVAITSLGYNTWRNEVSEQNRNQRCGSFELLMNADRCRNSCSIRTMKAIATRAARGQAGRWS